MPAGPKRSSSGKPATGRRRAGKSLAIERVQTGVRIEKRLLKVLKALAEYYDFSLGDLLEGIVLHSFEGRSPFKDPTLERIQQLMKVYEIDYDASASHRFVERDPSAGASGGA